MRLRRGAKFRVAPLSWDEMAGRRLLRARGGGLAVPRLGRLLEDLGLQDQRHRAELLDQGDEDANDKTGNDR